jgi:hypothetical protein
MDEKNFNHNHDGNLVVIECKHCEKTVAVFNGQLENLEERREAELEHLDVCPLQDMIVREIVNPKTSN